MRRGRLIIQRSIQARQARREATLAAHNSDWNTIAHFREAAGRCPNCGQKTADWLSDHGDGDDGFICQHVPAGRIPGFNEGDDG